jgi:hypothetical protein
LHFEPTTGISTREEVTSPFAEKLDPKISVAIRTLVEAMNEKGLFLYVNISILFYDK